MDTGAYGFRVDPAVFGRRYLNEPGEHWPELAVSLGTDPGAPPRAGWRVAFDGDGWTVQVAAGGHAVRWAGPALPGADARVHPLLSLVACAATLEQGGDCLHAGAVLTPAGVVAVLAPAGGGKTSTMAWLAMKAGLAVFTDDHLNLRHGLAHAGPRCLDLRPDAADALGLTGVAVRGAERHRLQLDPLDTLAAPVVRVVVLEWGSGVRAEVVRPRDRLGVLATHRTAQPVAGNLSLILGLAALPMVRLRRPRSFGCMAEVADAILAEPAGAAEA
ncbi:MAG TPA: hypothetical protein VES42_23370 [Pilimelia sp.]|nr:hypothetical protein [Pilimelia sp.]